MRHPLPRALRAAGAGFAHAVRTQRNLRIELTIALAVSMFGLWLGLSPLEVALLVTLIGLVVAAELVNTSIEALVDLLVPERQAPAGLVKDTAAAAVLVCAVTAAAGGIALLGRAFLVRLGFPVPPLGSVVLVGVALACAVAFGRLSRATAACYNRGRVYDRPPDPDGE